MNYKRISTFVGATLFTALLVASTADAGDLNAGTSQPSQNESPNNPQHPGASLMSQRGGRYS
jgi:hypothetical protein